MYDYLLPANGALALTSRATEGDALVIQKVRRRLLTHLGERVGQRNLGLPFLDWIASTDLAVISARVQAEIAQVVGVASVDNVSVTQEGRIVEITAQIRLSSGRKARLRFVPTGSQGGNVNPAISLILPMEGGLF